MKILAPSADPSAYQGGVWPTEPQQLLLQAALLDAPAAIDAWDAWQESGPIDALDSASWKLLPLVCVNLKRLGVSHPFLVQAKDCHLYHWRANQKLFFQSAAFLGELAQLKIPALVLKGVALANLYYPDAGSRPMADLDILVPAEKFMELGVLLIQRGWQETDGHSFAAFEMDTLPSFGFMRPDGLWVDIHYHVLHADCTRGADDEFWARAQPWGLRERPALALAPEHQLLHIISHGVRWCDVPPFRWIADAWFILARTRDTFDWARFIEQTRFHDIGLPILHGLDFMRQIVPLDLPPDLLPRLEKIPVSPKARIRFLADTNPLPTPFFPRAKTIWKVLGEDKPAYSIVGNPPPLPVARPAIWNLRAIPPFLLYACKVIARERSQILSESITWAARLLTGARASLRALLTGP